MPRMPRPRRFGLVALLAAVAVIASGCTTFAPPGVGIGTGTVPSTPTGENVSAELTPFYHQKLSWSDCGKRMQCTTVMAPLDWAKPSADKVELAVVRKPATGKNRIGSLLVNPGGPGGSGYDFVLDSVDYATDAALQKQYDVVGFDPRGVGRSTAVTCYGPKKMDDFLYGLSTAERGSDAWITEQTNSSQEFADACEQNSGDLLQHVDTVSAAHDLDLLRAVLGDSELHYLGYSYGTFLGATFAGLEPAKAGRLVLDGAIDPSTTNFEVTRTQAVGFENALKAYLTDCLTRTSCPFSGTVDTAMAKISALLAAVDASPIRNADGRQLGADTLVTAIIYPLYDATSWEYLSAMFASVMQGDASVAFQFADGYNGRNADGTYKDNSTEAFIAINCTDYAYDAAVERMRAEAAELEQAAPVIGKYMSYGDILCSVWPAKFTGTRAPIQAAGSPPILVVGTTGDPATPYVWAQNLAKQLENGHLLTYHGEGHTAYNKSNKCVNDTVDNFLLRGEVPATDPMC
ncbi:alpha/beta hydrolase [Homoserinimonas sp. OAct 916]|uniref:alpha/beta hydrolase n=1 Tax=Homoserinimonas sp. OAct 916 TaxID=2211450 RepID=UPI000DBE4CFB|nr:alpha/beta hydrolase [Homoserinimonas sp. OAct 916]